jgi:DivIVA domain-containing protein
MMWLFAVLVVLAMGGIALVAAGRGAPMVPAYDDRPDATVPREGVLGAQDLRRVRFSLAFRGYRMSEVDALLDRLAREKEAVDEPGEPRDAPEDGGGQNAPGAAAP